MSQKKILLVIENEDAVPAEVISFAQHVLKSGKFDEVEYQVNSRNLHPGDMLAALLRAEAIAVKSKWLYKDQLEAFAAAFALNGELRLKVYTFFIWDFVPQLNSWLKGEDVQDFYSITAFIDNIRMLIDAHFVYSIQGKRIYKIINLPNGEFQGYQNLR